MPAPGLVVIGSGPAGIAAANAYREADGVGPVTVLSGDVDEPYERPPLSKDFLQGRSTAADALLHDAEHYRDLEIDLRLDVAVATLDPAAHTVTTTSGTVVPFDQCVLATGSTPRRLPVPGADLPAVYLLRSMADAHRLRVGAAAARHAVVIGSGFIGCEAAASLALRAIAVTLVSPELAPQQTRLGNDVGQRLADWLQEDGVELVLGQSLTEITTTDGRTTVRTDGGRSVPGDVVVMAGGVTPNSELADTAGLAIVEGRIRVDERMRTSAPDIFAAGDVVFAFNCAAGRHLGVEHWGDALKMGEIAGRNAAGQDPGWASAPGFWSTIGDRTLKYAAWGDGFDSSEFQAHSDGAFTVTYTRHGRVVGVLTHNADDDYESGTSRVEQGDSTSAGLS